MKTLLLLISTVGLLVLSSCKKDNPDGPLAASEPDGYFPCDGRNYGYKVYGTQTWMTDNVAYLPFVVPSSTLSDSIPYYYVYGYEGTNPLAAKATANFQKYGVLYNWAAANKNACPPGWHLPTDGEWKTLELFLGMSETEIDSIYIRRTGSVGFKMKSTSGWKWEYRNGDNSSGFNVLPAGGVHIGGYFCWQGDFAMFWTFSKYGYNPDLIWSRELNYLDDGVTRGYSDRRIGMSVRCVKNL
jgi:uncharacterized protein (TIGR02145 family)